MQSLDEGTLQASAESGIGGIAHEEDLALKASLLTGIFFDDPAVWVQLESIFQTLCTLYPDTFADFQIQTSSKDPAQPRATKDFHATTQYVNGGKIPENSTWNKGKFLFSLKHDGPVHLEIIGIAWNMRVCALKVQFADEELGSLLSSTQFHHITLALVTPKERHGAKIPSAAESNGLFGDIAAEELKREPGGDARDAHDDGIYLLDSTNSWPETYDFRKNFMPLPEISLHERKFKFFGPGSDLLPERIRVSGRVRQVLGSAAEPAAARFAGE